jgi:hypothetical protein
VSERASERSIRFVDVARSTRALTSRRYMFYLEFEEGFVNNFMLSIWMIRLHVSFIPFVV